MKKPVVVVIGKPNVGKSTLINRLVGKRLAIVDDLPGVTRDRKYFDVNWQEREFILIDTGGLDPLSNQRMLSLIRKQVEIAIEEADLIVLVLDGKSGLDETDKNIAEKIRQSRKSHLLVVNKIDGDYLHLHNNENILQAYQLALGDPIPISSMHGLNITQLLDSIVKNIPFRQEEEMEKEVINIAIVGRPNVGKSSLLNKILGEERLIVDEKAGTTRDSIEVGIEKNGEHFNFIDTAGIRRKRTISQAVERYSVARAIKSIEEADVVLLLIDVLEGLADQDKKIIALIEKYGRGGIILVNKCDLADLDEVKKVAYQNYIKENISFVNYFPIEFISALNGYGLLKMFDLIKNVSSEYHRWVSTGNLNRLVLKAFSKCQPPAKGGKNLKVFYTTQVKSKPPSFLLFVNYPHIMTDNYKKYLISQIRKELGFSGTPIRIFVRERERS